MSIYGCSYCDYVTFYKCNIDKHIKTIKCKDANIITKNNKKLKCDICNKIYSRGDSLLRHYRNCGDKNIKLKETICDLENRLKDSHVVINNNINIGNINISNINNINIVVNSYDKTDLSKLNDKHFLNAIKRMIFCIPTIIKDIHFNPDIPENQNVYISNIKNRYVMVYNSETKAWDARPREEMINKLIDEKEYDIQEWLGEGEKYPKALEKFNEYLNKKENNDVQRKIREEVELVLYNNRNMIKNK
jgi:hypothetical protein